MNILLLLSREGGGGVRPNVKKITFLIFFKPSLKSNYKITLKSHDKEKVLFYERMKDWIISNSKDWIFDISRRIEVELTYAFHCY